jgi:hypothetical protein
VVDYAPIILSQYLATLEMLKQVITQCPEAIWNNSSDKTKVWQIAYHALFYTHFYLQDSEQAFTPWPKHRNEYQFIGQLPWPPHAAPQIGEPYSQEAVLEYLEFCQQQVALKVPQLQLEAASGFGWLLFNKLELQFYSIRHLQQHIGELMERLGERTGLEFRWVGMKPHQA